VKFYYGGSDPGIIRYGYTIRPAGPDRIDFKSAEPEYVYVDALGYQNARPYGFTATDARNEAYANVPTYFRKADLLRAAVPTPGGWVVPAQAQPIPADAVDDDRPMIRLTPATTRGASMPPRPLFIIPKKALEPKDRISGQHVANAQQK
jgi:hypothetical protein